MAVKALSFTKPKGAPMAGDQYEMAAQQQALADALRQRAVTVNPNIRRSSEGTMSAVGSIVNALLSNYTGNRAGATRNAANAAMTKKNTGIINNLMPDAPDSPGFAIQGGGQVDSVEGPDVAAQQRRTAMTNALAGQDPRIANQALTQIQVGRLTREPEPITPYQEADLQYKRDALTQGAADRSALAKDNAAARLQELTLKLADAKTAAQERNAVLKEIAQIRAGQNGQGRLGINERVGESGKVEFIPNTPQYVKAAQGHAKDYTAMTGANQTADIAINKINQILPHEKDAPDQKGDPSAFKNNFGGYNAALVTQRLPGKTQDVRANIESLKSNMKQYGLQLMRSGGSIGQMTEREWPIVEQALANITPMLSEDEAMKKLKEVRDMMGLFKSRAKEIYDAAWSDSQFYKGSDAGAPPPPAAAPPAPAMPSNPVAPFNDPNKERRYQEWLKNHK